MIIFVYSCNICLSLCYLINIQKCFKILPTQNYIKKSCKTYTSIHFINFTCLIYIYCITRRFFFSMFLQEPNTLICLQLEVSSMVGSVYYSHGFYIRWFLISRCARMMYTRPFSEKKIGFDDSFDVSVTKCLNESKCLIYSMCAHSEMSNHLT